MCTSIDRTAIHHMGACLKVCDHLLLRASAHLRLAACNSGAIGDEKHMIFECTALAPLRQKHADLFTPATDTMRSFFAQPDHLGVLNYVIDCLDCMDI